jgi:uncharacterized cupin superfamily protein
MTHSSNLTFYETIILLEGEVVAETEDRGEEGLSCIWDIKQPVKKHYNFR